MIIIIKFDQAVTKSMLEMDGIKQMLDSGEARPSSHVVSFTNPRHVAPGCRFVHVYIAYLLFT